MYKVVIAALLIVDGLSGIAGIITVALNLRGTLALLARFDRRPQTAYLDRASARGTAFGATAITTPPPPIEERVARLEERARVSPASCKGPGLRQIYGTTCDGGGSAG